MNPNKGITRVIIDCDSGTIKQENQGDYFENACIGFLLFCKYNFNGSLLLYPDSKYEKSAAPMITVNLEDDANHFSVISEKITHLATEEDREVFYGKFSLVPDLLVLIDWHANYFLIERVRISYTRKICSLFNACRLL